VNNKKAISIIYPILFIGVAFFLSLSNNVYAVDTEYESQKTYTTQDSPYGTARWAQTFITESLHSITSFDLEIQRYLGSPGTCSIGIYNTDGEGKPTGTALTEWSANTDAFDTAWHWHNFEVSEYNLQNGYKYAIVFYCPNSDGDNRLRWRLSDVNPYANNLAWLSSDGVNWTDYSTFDFEFVIYGNPIQEEQESATSTDLMLSDSLDYILVFFFSILLFIIGFILIIKV